jgi:hypothetical protein
MTRDKLRRCVNRRLEWVAVVCILGLSQMLGLGAAQAQEGGQVQVLTGSVDERAAGAWYLLPSLKQGQTLYVYAEGTSNNLDPLAALGDSSVKAGTLGGQFTSDVEQAIREGRDPLRVLPEFADKYFLAWDDDGGQGYAAAFEFLIPADGDYQLLVTNSPFNETFGTYRLLVGLDAPQVLTGEARPTGAELAITQDVPGSAGVAIQEITGSLTEAKPSTFLFLNDFEPDDTLTVFIEATSGDLIPAVVLEDFGSKPVRSGDYPAGRSQASLEYHFPDGGSNYRLNISGAENSTGDYRLLLGRNAPEVLSGQAAPGEELIARQPIQVKVGVRLDQITDVDQKAENYGAVVSVRMEWTDPALAFSPEDCNCAFKLFTQKDFDKFIAETDGQWPEFTLFNQQNNRWTQNRLVVIQPNGQATYFERFTTTFQAPDFDFRRFPFDTQQFYIRVDAVYPEEYFVFSDLEQYTAVGTQLGEEEWYVTDSDIEVTSETALTGNITSRYSFRFEAKRHLIFYVFRILVPLLLIIIVAWITFFLKDFTKRIEATSANLLLFIAYNFTIGNSLPALGYLTFLDTILMAAFIISVLMVAYSVYLKWLEVQDQRDRAERIDRFMIWLYPLGYVLASGIVVLIFFVLG